MTGPEQHAATVDFDRVAGRLSACREDVSTRPYSHPIAVGWYAEDVPALVALAGRADEPTENEKRAREMLRERMEQLQAKLNDERARANELWAALRSVAAQPHAPIDGVGVGGAVHVYVRGHPMGCPICAAIEMGLEREQLIVARESAYERCGQARREADQLRAALERIRDMADRG